MGEIVATYHFGGSWSHKYGSEEFGSKKSELLKTSNRNIEKLDNSRVHLVPTFQAQKSPKHTQQQKYVVAGKNLPYASHSMGV